MDASSASRPAGDIRKEPANVILNWPFLLKGDPK